MLGQKIRNILWFAKRGAVRAAVSLSSIMSKYRENETIFFLPFPSNGRQKEYREGLVGALTTMDFTPWQFGPNLPSKSRDTSFNIQNPSQFASQLTKAPAEIIRLRKRRKVSGVLENRATKHDTGRESVFWKLRHAFGTTRPQVRNLSLGPIIQKNRRNRRFFCVKCSKFISTFLIDCSN